MATQPATTPVLPSAPSATSTPAEALKSVAPSVAESPAGLFEIEELEQFRSDDAAAARTIGKILSTLFLYTLIVMSLVVWWTLKTVLQ
jgi:hypothetical protein